MITIKSPREIALMREAGRIVSETFTVLAKAIKPGVTTIELDRLAENFIRQKHVRPAFKGLYNFPASICTSVNEEVVHGIPGQRKLKEGDI
ncbi:MAG TPA: type I methionyl aminopeptidase, partial [Desulfotomaculum sp.]|nr:type I methionyl aminopeptidase [Desulfotomaculum sp.]